MVMRATIYLDLTFPGVQKVCRKIMNKTLSGSFKKATQYVKLAYWYLLCNVLKNTQKMSF